MGQLKRKFFPNFAKLLKSLPKQLAAEYADAAYNMLIRSFELNQRHALAYGIEGTQAVAEGKGEAKAEPTAK